jgi:hypothetical protein
MNNTRDEFDKPSTTTQVDVKNNKNYFCIIEFLQRGSAKGLKNEIIATIFLQKYYSPKSLSLNDVRPWELWLENSTVCSITFQGPKFNSGGQYIRSTIIRLKKF